MTCRAVSAEPKLLYLRIEAEQSLAGAMEHMMGFICVTSIGCLEDGSIVMLQI